MKIIPRRFDRCAFVVVTSLLGAHVSAGGATVRKAHTASPAAKAGVPNTSIIPLPLTPIVPVAQRRCSARTSSGLGFTILRRGAGAVPASTDTATINYVGYLAATGAVFDQNLKAELPVDQVIPGFSEGLKMLPRTGIVRLCIPAALGYGAKATGPIPANADLVFQVELVDFKKTADAEAAQAR